MRALLFAEAPAARLAAVRVLVGAYAAIYVAARARYFADLSALDPAAYAPVGLMHLFRAPPPPWLHAAVTGGAIASSVAFTAGARFRASAPAATLSLFWIFSARSSFGKVLHTENLLLLHVALLAVAPSAAAWSVDAARRAEPAASPRYGWPLRAIALVTVLTYFVAGVAKLRTGGVEWLSGRPLAEWLTWDAVRKIELGSLSSPLAPLLASHPSWTAALAVLTVAIEVGAPVALLSRRVAVAWVLLAWAFHAGVLATMAIGFFYPLTLVAYASFFEPERALARLRAAVSRRPR